MSAGKHNDRVKSEIGYFFQYSYYKNMHCVTGQFQYKILILYNTDLNHMLGRFAFLYIYISPMIIDFSKDYSHVQTLYKK